MAKHSEHEAHDTATMTAFPNGSILGCVKAAMIVIERVGFPIFATVAIFFVAYTSQQKLTDALQENTRTLLEFKTSVTKDHERMMSELDKRLAK